ncbi:MAG: metallophosphoesterase [Ignavibacteria bacterium]
MNYKTLLIFITCFICSTIGMYAQTPNIILGRPTDTSITASVLMDKSMEWYAEYGTSQGIYAFTSKTVQSDAGIPFELDLNGLQPNTRYYYRIQYKSNGSSFSVTPEYTFHTQRAKGSTFKFTIEADEHLYDKKGVRSLYQICLANQAAEKPDFMLSLGDTFGDDHNPFDITSKELQDLHLDYRPFLGALCHSVPFYFCLGNHEGEMDYYLLKNPGANLAVWGTLWRKFYYPNPYPNGFYSGNTNEEAYGIGTPENYYAWTWGDALFVVLDVYRDQCDTSAKPQNWNWTLGYPQYSWLRKTLEESNSKYKFVFAHHVRGQGRGAKTNAPLFEWGGKDSKGVYQFDKYRPNWGKPIHQLFVDNGVNIFFQGHDHLFAHEVLDGVTYQECPMPSDSTYEIGKLANADAYLSDTLGGSGHLTVTVSPEGVKVDYVTAWLPADTSIAGPHNRDIAFSYTVGGTTGIEDHISNESRQESSVYDAVITLNNVLPDSQNSLIDMYGKTVALSTGSTIETQHIPSGKYLLVTKNLHESTSRSIFIIH